MKNLLLLIVFVACISSCKKDDSKPEEPKIVQLEKITPVSLDYKTNFKTVPLSYDVSILASISVRHSSDWINSFSLFKSDENKSSITFSVSEFTGGNTGYRSDTIDLKIKGTLIGYIEVYQARNYQSGGNIQWAKSGATGSLSALGLSSKSGAANTKKVYLLSKNSQGDSYKNYPAFSYCIEMNHDPEHNMEWFLPSKDEIDSLVLKGGWDKKQYWTSEENISYGYTAWVYSVENSYQGVSIHYDKCSYANNRMVRAIRKQ